MVGHIYGKVNLLNDTYRSNMFIKELGMYVDYFKDLLQGPVANVKEEKRRNTFQQNLLGGIAYYKELFQQHFTESNALSELKIFLEEVRNLEVTPAT